MACYIRYNDPSNKTSIGTSHKNLDMAPNEHQTKIILRLEWSECRKRGKASKQTKRQNTYLNLSLVVVKKSIVETSRIRFNCVRSLQNRIRSRLEWESLVFRVFRVLFLHVCVEAPFLCLTWASLVATTAWIVMIVPRVHQLSSLSQFHVPLPISSVGLAPYSWPMAALLCLSRSPFWCLSVIFCSLFWIFHR